MSSFAFVEVEQSLLQYRVARRLVQTALLDYITSSERLTNPFLLLSRLFIRLKSADSILEKIQRKRLTVQSVSEIGQVMDDLLGLRIITENLDELWAIDQFLTGSFEVKSRLDRIDPPGQYGYRSIEYALIYHGADVRIPFEVQLRTQLQHYWASRSFHLFHKVPPTRAQRYEETLVALSQALTEAEELASSLGARTVSPGEDSPNLNALPIQSQVNLVVVEPGERFAQHVIVTMSGNDLSDHQSIVDQKVALYAKYPDAAIVECNCMTFSTFTLNEPHVEIPVERLEQIVWQ